MGEIFAGPGFRTCSRAACRWPAIATLSFDYAERRAWLDNLNPNPHPSRYDLCAVHAGRFGPPEGWSIQDLRPAEGRLAATEQAELLAERKAAEAAESQEPVQAASAAQKKA